MFGSRKVGEFGESSVLCQTLTSQILAYKWLKPIYSPNVFCQILFIWPIRQTLTPSNIPAIRYVYIYIYIYSINMEYR